MLRAALFRDFFRRFNFGVIPGNGLVVVAAISWVKSVLFINDDLDKVSIAKQLVERMMDLMFNEISGGQYCKTC